MVAAKPGPVSRLAFGWRHGGSAEARSGHVLTLGANRDGHVCQLVRALDPACSD
jgi:hypothetical protein